MKSILIALFFIALTSSLKVYEDHRKYYLVRKDPIFTNSITYPANVTVDPDSQKFSYYSQKCNKNTGKLTVDQKDLNGTKMQIGPWETSYPLKSSYNYCNLYVMPSWDELFIKVRSYQNYRAYMDLYDENGTFLLRLDQDFDPLRNYNEYDFGH